MSQPITLRLASDTDEALTSFADKNGLSRPEAVSTIVSEFLVNQSTTPKSLRERLAAEKRLMAEVVNRGETLRDTQFEQDVTRSLFKWIAEHHFEDYALAIGKKAEFRNRLNPLLAKRFAAALAADYFEIKDGKPVRVDLPAATNELIKSYTPLKPTGG